MSPEHPIHLPDLIGALWRKDDPVANTDDDEAARRVVQDAVCTRGGITAEAFQKYAQDRAFDCAVNSKPDLKRMVGPSGPDATEDPAVFAAFARLDREGLTAELLAQLAKEYPNVLKARGLTGPRAGQGQPPSGGESAGEALAEIDVDILKVLAAAPGAVIADSIAFTVKRHVSTVRDHLKALRNRGLTYKPGAGRSGESLTEAGRQVATTMLG